jgi:hypothetical protein
VLVTTYFFIAACSGLKGREFSFCWPELAALDASDKVAVALPPDSGSIVFIPDISPPLPNKLEADVASELGKLEFCGLLFAVPTAGFATFGKGKNLLLATRLGAEDG